MEVPGKPAPRRTSHGYTSQFDFNLEFQASRIPNYQWDRSVISLIPVDTGKVSIKTGKGHVQHNNCHWPEPVIESTWISRDHASKQFHEKIYKLVVSTGVSRPVSLGETSINLSEFVDANSPRIMALPLENCDTATVLHVKIQCITPITAHREFKLQRELGSHQEYQGSHSDEENPASDNSANYAAGSVATSVSGQQSYLNQIRQGRTDSPRKPHRDILAKHSSESLDSMKTSPRRGTRGHREHSSSRSIPFTPHVRGSENGSQDSPIRSQRGREYARGDLEAAEAAIQELRSEAMTWERQTRKLNLELETVKQKLVAESKRGDEFWMEMSALQAERNSLKADLEHLKAARLISIERQSGVGHARSEAEDAKRIIKELQEDLEHQKETNTNLNIQLHKTHDSNLELVLAVTELKEALDEQTAEIQRLKEQNTGQDAERTRSSIDLDCEWSKKAEILESEWREKFMSLEERLHVKEDEVKKLEDEVSSLRNEANPLAKPVVEQENEGLGKNMGDWMQKLSEKDSEIERLKSMLLPRVLVDHPHGEMHEDLHIIIENLKKENEELERDCQELTTENIDLLQKLQRTRQRSQHEEQNHLDGTSEYCEEANPEIQRLQSELDKCRRLLQNKENDLERALEKVEELNKSKEVQFVVTDLKRELRESSNSKHILEVQVHALIKQIEELESQLQDCEAKLTDTHGQLGERDAEISILNQKLADLVAREKKMEATKSAGSVELEKALNDHLANEEKLEASMQELEKHSTRLEGDIERLLEEKLHNVSRIQELEVQVSYLMNEVQDLNASKTEIETQASNLKTESQEINEKLAMAQEENNSFKERVEVLTASLDSQLALSQSLESRIEDLHRIKLDLEEEKHQLLTGISELEEKLKYMAEEAECQRVEKEIVLTRSLDIQTEKERIENSLQEKVHEVSKLEQKLGDALREVNSGYQERCQLEKDFEQLRNDFSLINNSKRELEVKLLNLQDSYSHLEQELHDTQENCMSYKTEVASLKAEMDSFQRASHQKERNLQEEIDSLVTLKSNLEKQMTNADDSFRKLQEEKVSATESLQEKLEILTEQLSSSYNQMSELHDEKSQLEELLRETQDRVHEIEEAASTMKRDMSLEADSLRKKQKDLEEALQNALKEIQQMRTMEADFTSKIEEAENKLIQLGKDKELLSEKNTELSTCASELSGLRAQINVLNAKMEQMSLEKTASETHLKKLLGELKKLEDANVTLRNSEVNKQPDHLLSTDENPNILERVTALETELAEALEANSMYKLQLKTAFATQNDTSMSVSGGAEQAFNDLEMYRSKAHELEEKLADMLERYSLMSLKFAEVEAERGELIIAVKNLRNGKK